jgi:predicted  nucleic acid-binding Zn-ribbon protein
MMKDLEKLSSMMIDCAFDISKLGYVGIFIRMQEMLGNCIYQHKGFEKLAIEAWKTAFNTFLVGTYSKNKPCEHLDIFNYNPEKTVKLIYELDPTYEDPFGVAKKLRKNEKFITCPKCGKSFHERESACPECGCTKQEIEQIEEERRIQAEKEAEERRIQAEKEAEEARIRAEQEAAEQAARRKEWWQKNWKKVIVIISILIAVIAVIATFKNISNQKSIALANQYIASGDSCVAIYQFDKAEQFYYSAANSTKDGKTLNIINQKHYDLNDARSAADYEYDQSLKRLRILLAADDYIFNKYSNQELDKMIKIYPNRQETIYYQNLRKQ